MDTENLLDANDEEALYRSLLLQAAELQQLEPGKMAMPFNTVIPDPGFCLKTKLEQGDKVFINICKSDQMPAPREINDEQLLKIIDSDNPDYRVPMSLGEPHAELDKSGKGCTAYDVVINTSFYERVMQSQLMQRFFLSIVFEGLETKYNVILDREWTILKNRKFLGSIPEQNIRSKSKPQIQEVESEAASGGAQRPLITELEGPGVEGQQPATEDKNLHGPEPKYVILREPPEGHPEFLVGEVQLPNLKSARTLSLDLGEDRILLHAHPCLYHLDIYIPYNLVQDDCGAQFNRKTKVLTLTLPVKP